MERLYKELKSKERKGISDHQILEMIDTNILSYSDLEHYNNVDEILKNNSCIILYENTTPDGNGHWVCVIKRNGIIHYFDPYGRVVDTDQYLRGRSKELLRILMNSPYDVYYNRYNFQKKGAKTCGRHVITRILLKDYSIDEYKKIMSRVDRDALVTFITHQI
jgi:hypothetical protein